VNIGADLARIEGQLHRLDRTELLGSLEPPLSADEVARQLAEAGLAATSDLIAYFGWHNGSGPSTASIGQLALFPGFYALSLGDALKNYVAFVPDARWHAGWLPIFADGGGYFYVTDLSSARAGVMRMFRNDESEHPIEHVSLAKMIETLAEAYDRGVFYADGEYIEAADDAFDRIAAELNPGVAWWVDE
jgi:hypothetical protein